MFTLFRRVSPKFAWLGTATILCAFACTANAQTKELSLEQIEQATTTGPYALFQFATLTGTGNTITGVLVPVVLSNGTIVYDNVTLAFNVSSSGALSLGSLTSAAAQIPVIAGFEAGQYFGPSTINGGKNIINVSGPGVATGGVTEWTLAAANGASGCTYPGTATWYVGPLADSPLAGRVKAAGITATNLYFGVGNSSSCSYGEFWWEDPLLGFSQVGNTITIVSFSVNGTDYSTPRDQITYTLVP